jgi:hypothetical protein
MDHPFQCHSQQQDDSIGSEMSSLSLSAGSEPGILYRFAGFRLPKKQKQTRLDDELRPESQRYEKIQKLRYFKDAGNFTSTGVLRFLAASLLSRDQLRCHEQVVVHEDSSPDSEADQERKI